MTCQLSGLFRLRLALLNGVTAIGGYCLLPAPIQPVPVLALFCGVSLLAMGGSALNQLLERDIDALMTRTMLRPLPQGRLSAPAALFIGSCTILAGAALLASTGAILPPLLGVAALIWYLAVYTPLKRTTTLALAARFYRDGHACSGLRHDRAPHPPLVRRIPRPTGTSGNDALPETPLTSFPCF